LNGSQSNLRRGEFIEAGVPVFDSWSNGLHAQGTESEVKSPVNYRACAIACFASASLIGINSNGPVLSLVAAAAVA